MRCKLYGLRSSRLSYSDYRYRARPSAAQDSNLLKPWDKGPTGKITTLSALPAIAEPAKRMGTWRQNYQTMKIKMSESRGLNNNNTNYYYYFIIIIIETSSSGPSVKNETVYKLLSQPLTHLRHGLLKKSQLRGTTNGWLQPWTHPAFSFQIECREGHSSFEPGPAGNTLQIGTFYTLRSWRRHSAADPHTEEQYLRIGRTNAK